MERGLLINVLLVLVMIIGSCNFFAQFIFPGFRSDPVITGAFWGIAGIILGVKGINKRNGENKE